MLLIRFDPSNRKIGKYEKKIFENFFSSKIALKLSKSPYSLNIFEFFSFLNRTLGLRKYFLNKTTYVLSGLSQAWGLGGL
jgi:hypothetical protein